MIIKMDLEYLGTVSCYGKGDYCIDKYVCNFVRYGHLLISSTLNDALYFFDTFLKKSISYRKSLKKISVYYEDPDLTEYESRLKQSIFFLQKCKDFGIKLARNQLDLVIDEAMRCCEFWLKGILEEWNSCLSKIHCYFWGDYTTDDEKNIKTEKDFCAINHSDLSYEDFVRLQKEGRFIIFRRQKELFVWKSVDDIFDELETHFPDNEDFWPYGRFPTT